MIFLKEQKIYLDKINEILKSSKEDFSYYIETFGCTLNENDSEKICGMLDAAGFIEKKSPINASIIVFNTCCIRENAENKLFGRLGRVKEEAKKGAIIIVTGCMMQEPVIIEKMKKSFPYVDLILGTHTLFRFPENLYKIIFNIYIEGNDDISKIKERKREKTKIDVLDIDGEIYEGIPVKHKDKSSAYVAIMFGCNNFCTYCIVPYVRGRERSRDPEIILKEVKYLAESGYKEIILLGQNVNSYKGKGNILTFANLLEEVAKINGVEKVSFVSPHPKDFTSDVIDVIAKYKNISRNLHYPLQSGSNNILKKMNRRYTREEYIKRAKEMKEKIPEISFSTDIIVGFPGETEEDFEETLSMVKEIDFDQIYMFIYSPREGTVAAKWKDEYVLEEVASNRFERLKQLFNKRLDEINEKYIGKIEQVIIEGESKNNKNNFVAKSINNKTYIFPKNNKNKKGDIVKVKVIKNNRWFLTCEIVDD